MFDMSRGFDMQCAFVSCTKQAMGGALPAATVAASADKAAETIQSKPPCAQHIHRYILLGCLP